MEDNYYAKLQRYRFHYITSILALVQVNASYPEPEQTTNYYGSRAGIYFTLADHIRKDIISDYNSKPYENNSIHCTRKIKSNQL